MASPTTGRWTAPHLAKHDLVYVTPERLDEFFAAVVHDFHDDYVSAKWEPHRKVLSRRAASVSRSTGAGFPPVARTAGG